MQGLRERKDMHMKFYDLNRRTFVGAAAATAAVTLAGCSSSDDSSSGSSSSDSTEEATKELYLYPAVSPATLDPQNDSNADDAEITDLLGEGLFRYSSDGVTPENAVCESYTVSDDGLTYTFTLGESVWQDGTAVTAGDFVYSLQRFFDPSTASENAGSYYSYILNAEAVYNGEADVSELGVSATDDSTLVVTLGSLISESTVKAFFTNSAVYPMNQTAIEAGGDGWSTDPEYHLSNGLYILSEYNADSSVVIEKNSAYVGSGTAYADKITYQMYGDSSAAQVAMANGDVSYYKYADETLLATLGDDAQTQIADTLSTSCLFLNWRCAPLDDVNVRKAICLAIDEVYTNETLESGYATVAKGFIGDKFTDPVGGSFRTDDNALIDDFSDEQLAEAQQALSDAGYPGGEGLPTLVYMTMSTTKGTARAEFFQALLKDNLGIDVDVEAYDVPTYLSLVTGEDYAFSYMTLTAGCDNVIEMLANNVTDYGSFGVSIPEYDELYSQLQFEADAQTQSDLMHEAEEILLNEYYAFRPIVYGYNIIALGNEVDQLVVNPGGNAMHNYTHLSTW